jgi:hypothetical protein
VIKSGQHFTFVSADKERRVEYVVDDAEGEQNGEQDPGSRVSLLNPATGKHANVTVFWLTQGELEGRMHWVASS